MSATRGLIGINTEFDLVIRDFAFLARLNEASHRANAGDVSQVIGDRLAEILLARFAPQASAWFPLDQLKDLQFLRRDGRAGYRAEGITNPRYYELVRPIAGRVLLITRTGSQLPAISETLLSGEDGRLLNIVEVSKDATAIRLLYGHAEYGSIPSIETHVHLLANAVGIAEGQLSPATVHAHPPNLVSLARHPKIRGSFAAFNAAVYTSVEGLNRNYTGLIGVVPYRQSGTRALVDATIEPLLKHRLVLWMNHGFVVREENIRRAYTLLAYAEECAKAALFSLDRGAMRLPDAEVFPFLEENHLLDAYKGLFDADA